ncbi:hypothetical protein N657DRAFT_638101 [Parathielavia appendiculata]|uniref:Heterokaryon incompatibility domain-containing protein n=1 Tax=Parathielavia appendiculata TaxID=2587402 RepID=A0AAN6TPQ6_9PEZI|nr:hypothetical protein N657DRAFT_638101 [Parathielavia appendiculata]
MNIMSHSAHVTSTVNPDLSDKVPTFAVAESPWVFLRKHFTAGLKTYNRSDWTEITVAPLPAPAIDVTQNEEPPELPTRVIAGCADPVRHPVLVESQSRKDRYIALSHCWGSTASSITKAERGDSMQRRLQEVPFNELSTNFRHAVEVTHALGYQYLWINSLHIVQDDWAVESAKMAEVYTPASLTVAAANSAWADEGFLQPRQRRRTVMFPFQGGPGVISSYFTVAEPSPEDAKELRDSFHIEVDGGPLAARGWTPQERLLARRIAFFGKDQLHRDTRLLNDWYRVLGEFTRRGLTNKEDKLPALLGIAKVISQGFGPGFDTTYHAGLWARDLPRALPWKTVAPDAGTGAALPGPSWSWISRDAAIYLASEESTAVTDILGAAWDIVLAGSDAHGRVKQGTLTLTGSLKQVSSIQRIEREPRVVGPFSCPLSDALLFDGQGQQIASAVLDEPADASVYAQPLYAVPVRHAMAKTKPALSILSIEALLLQDKDDGTSRRVGVASMGGSNAKTAKASAMETFASPTSRARPTTPSMT